MTIPLFTRYAGRKVDAYLEQLQEEDFSQPDEDTLKAISTLVNRSTRDNFLEMNTFLRSCPQIKRGVKTLNDAPRLRGPAKTAASHLSNFTPYEQMSTLSTWVDTNNFPKAKRTLSFGHEDGSIPIMISPPPKSKLDLYPVFIGNATGDLKGPAYPEWQKEDPKGTTRELFIDSLDALEVHRTGMGDGALLLKKAAYESGVIDHGWRYKVVQDKEDAPEASVELVGQKQPKAARARAFAPGFNLAKMIADEKLREQSIMPERYYEDFCDEDYDDEAIPVVTPMKMAKSFKSAIGGDTDELDSLVQLLSASHLGISKLPVVKEYTARRLGF